MRQKLERYAAQAFSLLYGHWLTAESNFEFLQPDEDTLIILGRAIVIDGSSLYITEVTEIKQEAPSKIRYSYQFRNESEQGFFRYDSASHGRPEQYHHKHEYGKPI